jgi:3-oxoacyl-[acyl-carrier-protein] synthase II
MQDRIVITGMGTVNPLGLNVKDSWENVIAGKSGVGPITIFDSYAANLQVHIAAEVKNFKPEEFMEAREARRRDRFEQFAAAAAKEAIANSGLEITEANSGRIGVIISSAIGGLQSLQEAILTNHKEGPRKVSPFLIPMLMANGGAGMAAIEFGIKGPCFSVASACASGADGIGTALDDAADRHDRCRCDRRCGSDDHLHRCGCI